MQKCKASRAELSPLSNSFSSVFSLKRGIWGQPSFPRMTFGTWIGSGSRPCWSAMSRPGGGLPAIGREIRSSRGQFPIPGSRRPLGSPAPASTLRWPVGSSAVDIPGAKSLGPDPPVVPVARAAPRGRQGALPIGLRLAVHRLGPHLLRPKEACQARGSGRARNGQDEDQSEAGGKHRVQHRRSSASGTDPDTQGLARGLDREGA